MLTAASSNCSTAAAVPRTTIVLYPSTRVQQKVPVFYRYGVIDLLEAILGKALIYIVRGVRILRHECICKCLISRQYKVAYQVGWSPGSCRKASLICV